MDLKSAPETERMRTDGRRSRARASDVWGHRSDQDSGAQSAEFESHLESQLMDKLDERLASSSKLLIDSAADLDRLLIQAREARALQPLDPSSTEAFKVCTSFSILSPLSCIFSLFCVCAETQL